MVPKAPDPSPKAEAEARRRRVGRALATWAAMALGGLAIVAGLALWHLHRRGRLLLERGRRTREVDWPEPEPDP